MTGDRADVYTPENWTGPDYALGMVDEIVVHGCVAHFEMSSESDGYLHIQSPRREVFARIYARPASRAERRQMAAGGDPDPPPRAVLCVEVEIDEETPAQTVDPDHCGDEAPSVFGRPSTTWCVRRPGHGVPHRDQDGAEWVRRTKPEEIKR